MPAGSPYDSIEKSRWLTQRINIAGSPSTPTDVTINYLSCPPPEGTSSKGTILLIHGYPETWYQFRHVITPLSDAGYHVIVPDYRGAGTSSHPRDGYDKVTMATDIHTLLTEHLGIEEKRIAEEQALEMYTDVKAVTVAKSPSRMAKNIMKKSICSPTANLRGEPRLNFPPSRAPSKKLS
ncbi:hypothetical protein KVT40_006666 [Elsinoe batatas]|uniref:AB hydrolase-1 domain-containing protein n=1 Tax=Elsinoe batatas TaxID=2601811 RepID=A0A8K0PAR4_9PEZI|nr:hypothetical protein KVT40_006666 [Elsinoe batatas]